jgi:hypothetical protein
MTDMKILEDAVRDDLNIVIYLSESHDHRWAKTIDEGGSLLSMISIKLPSLVAKERVLFWNA